MTGKARPDLSQRRTKVEVQVAPDLGVDPIDLTPVPTAPARPPTPKAPTQETRQRINFDVSLREYRALLAAATEIADQLGKAKLAYAPVFRALIEELSENPELRSRVITRMIA